MSEKGIKNRIRFEKPRTKIALERWIVFVLLAILSKWSTIT